MERRIPLRKWCQSGKIRLATILWLSKYTKKIPILVLFFPISIDLPIGIQRPFLLRSKSRHFMDGRRLVSSGKLFHNILYTHVGSISKRQARSMAAQSGITSGQNEKKIIGKTPIYQVRYEDFLC